MELGWVRRKRARSFVGVYGVVRYFCCWSTRGGSAWNSYDTSRCLISIMTPSRGWGRTYVFGSAASSYVWYLCTSGMYYDGDLGMKMGVLLPLNAVRVLIFWWFPGLQTRCSVGGVWGFQWVVSDISQRQNFTQYLKSGRERSRFAVPDEFHLKKGVEPSSPSSVIIISRSVHNQQTPKSLHSTYISTPSRAAFFKETFSFYTETQKLSHSVHTNRSTVRTEFFFTRNGTPLRLAVPSTRNNSTPQHGLGLGLGLHLFPAATTTAPVTRARGAHPDSEPAACLVGTESVVF
jgi:hypothetical protein